MIFAGARSYFEDPGKRTHKTMLQAISSEVKSYFESTWNRIDQTMYLILAVAITFRWFLTEEQFV